MVIIPCHTSFVKSILIYQINISIYYLLAIKQFTRKENVDTIKGKTKINEQMSNNEELGAYYYITRPRLRIGTVIEQKFIYELPDRQVRKETITYMDLIV